MIRKWFNGIRASRRWTRALDLASRREFSSALALVEEIEKLDINGDESRPSESGVYLNILKACLLSNLGRHQETLDLIARIQRVFRGRPSVQKDYLEGYVSELAHFAISNAKMTDAPPELALLLTKELNKIDLTRVPAHLKRKFPLPTHPDWDRNLKL